MSLTYPVSSTKIDVKTIKLTSPLLRVGGAVTSLNPFEYVDFGNAVYLPDADVLARELYHRGHLKDYLDRVENRQEIGTLLQRVFGNDWLSIKSTDGYPIFPLRLPKWTDDRITDFRPMIGNGMGQLYIPGSSIKGAIRTAIAYYLIKHQKQFNTPIAQQPSVLELKIREKLEIKAGKKSKLTTDPTKLDNNILINPLFSDFTISYHDRTLEYTAGKEPNTDFMRAVKVSDSVPLLEKSVPLKSGKIRKDNLAIAGAVKVSSHFQDDKAKHRANIYAEMVRNANTTFTITLDLELLSWFKHNQGMEIPFNSIEDLLTICQEFAQEQWDAEHDYWNQVINNPHREHQLDFDDIRDLYEPETCPYQLRVGWGTGMNGTTIDLMLSDKLRAEIRDACGIPAPGFDAPKSRHTVVNQSGEIKYALGWTKLQLNK
jgi:CRISPR-associated protein Csm5